MRLLQKVTTLLICATTAVIMAGCGTLLGNKNPEVVMDSDPPVAKIYINGNFAGNTPIRLKLKNDKQYVIEFRKEGFKPKTYILGNHIGAGWLVLDILGGLWPNVIDLITGGWYELDTNKVKVLLELN